jgi:methylated-DNA-[protein]-cysteine S-methyltransferase
MRHQDRTRYRLLKSPAGTFYIAETADGRMTAGWLQPGNGKSSIPAHWKPDPNLRPRLAAQLERYFKGQPQAFDGVPTPTGSPFFERCWSACRAIPPGTTISYAELARRAGGSPSAARAAGQAMRRNPLAVIVPCHRVVASGGSLYGYSGSRDPAGPELAIKRTLLELEGATPRDDDKSVGH